MHAQGSANIAIERLYGDHHQWLYRWLHRRLGNEADAADLAHDAFLRLLQTPQHFTSAPQARSYLRQMANGLCIDLWRRRTIEQAWLDTLAARPQTTAPSAEHQLIVLQALQEVDTLLRSLPPKVTRTFMLAVAGDMTHKEVAAELGISTRTVTTHVAQAMLHCLQLEARHVVQELTAGGPFSPFVPPADC